MTRVWIGLAAALLALTATVAAAQTGYKGRVLSEADFQKFLVTLKAEAVEKGVSKAVVDTAFRGVVLDTAVIERDQNQPEFSKPIWAYLDSAVSAKRVRDGLAARARADAILKRVEAAYGVPAGVMAAVWGVESNFGAIRGDWDVVRSLSTLIYNGRRARFWRAQLFEALRIMERGEAGVPRLKGSWASAMGHTQLIPEAFRRYGTDFDGDGRVNIWSDDPTDAIASTAKYLQSFDWRGGQPAFLVATLPEKFDYAKNVERTRSTLDWAKLGVKLGDGGDLPFGLTDAKLLLPAGARGPAFLALPNFRVIMRYNPSTAYAMAVAMLAERLDGKPARSLNWPRDDRPLSRTERFELQERLTELGFDTKGVDGILGRNSRAALRAFQASKNVIADGYASASILKTLREASPDFEPKIKPPSAASASVRRPTDERPLNPAEIKELQELLNKLGCNVGEPDGLAGGRTEAGATCAVKKHNLAAAPAVGPSLLAALRKLAEQ